MRRACDLARRGRGKTHPNPVVGAVIVKDGHLLSEGWHRKAGGPHAEVAALSALPSRGMARGATVYVTLEPCCTSGRTPPCTGALIAAGVHRVVFGATDPNPVHAGRAIDILKHAGLEVLAGVCADECAALNLAWNHWIATGRPFVTVKAGSSLDGRISSHPLRRWITSEAARRDAMKLRRECDAILVGAGTVRADNPRLTIRGLRSKRQPWRVVWSLSGNIPSDCHLLTDEFRDRTLVLREPTLEAALQALGRREVQHVLIEGGGTVHGMAFDQRLVNRLVFYIAPVLLGGGVPAIGGQGVGDNREAVSLREVRHSVVGGDLRIEGRVVFP